MTKSTVIIVNLGSGTAKQKFAEIEDSLKDAKTFIVKNPKEFSSVYIKALKVKPKKVVLAGGDGTIIKGIESLVKLGYKGKFALLPFGTANYLARNLDIPLTPREALETAMNGQKTAKVPLGSANGQLFALMFTMGLTRSVSDNVNDLLKQKIGQLAYIIELFKQSKKHEAFSYEVEANGKTIKGVTHQFLAYNSDLNPQLKLVPDHELKKPTIKVVISKSKHNILRLFFSFLLFIFTFGKYTRMLKVYEFEKLTIKTSPMQKFSLDGEVSGKGEVVVTAASQSVRIINS